MRKTTIILALALLFTVAAEAQDWSSGVPYLYDGSGNVRKMGNDPAVYDAAGRLTHSYTNGVKRTYTYDAFGNRLTCIQTPGSDCQYGRTISATKNRIAGIPYDAAGNVTAMDGVSFTYDALNMQTRAAGAATIEYIYTADDERIAIYDVGQGAWRWTLRDASAKVLREFTSRNGTGNGALGNTSWSWVKDYVWRDGLLVATRQPGATPTLHYHLDHLGTPRRITDDTNRIVGQHSYHAFGPETTGGTNETPVTPLKFTGHERDGELDYMHARFYDPKMGRFLSVDPVLDVREALHEPQLWNRYSYVTNNPLTFTDPDGRYRTFYKEKPMTAENLAMDENTPAVVRYSVYATGGLTGVGAAGFLGAGGLVASATEGLSTAGAWALANWDKVQRFAQGVADFLSPGPAASFERSTLQLTGELRYTNTAAQSLAKAGRDIPGPTIAAAILSGTRSADPQGAKGAIQITQDVYKYAQRGGQWVQVKYQLRIIYNEAEKLVMHANIKEVK